MRTFLLVSAIVAALTLPAHGADIESQPTVAGVAAIEAHWTQAFVHGDATYLQALLSDDYVSVSAAGVPRDRATIVKLALAFAARNGASPLPAPPPQTIRVQGTTAVVTTDANGQRSVDVFYYAGERWHAWYSQHTAIVTKQ